MAEDQKGVEGSGKFVDSLRDIQGEYIMLTDLYEKERSYAQKLSEMMRALQFEVDSTIQIRSEILGEGYRAAYLVSEAVVVAFSKDGGMISRPLYRLPPNVIVSVIEECAPELRRLISDKRLTETNRVRSLERVLKELKKAQATFKQTRREELDGSDDESKTDEKDRGTQDDSASETRPQQKEPQEVAPQQRQASSKEGFAFKGSFGDKREIPGISP